MTTDRLPRPLAAWSGALSALSPALATALGPLLRRIEALVDEREPYTASDGVVDGYGGLARTGPPERLLASEWLLGQEVPDEFLRRAAAGELLYTAPEFRSAADRGRVVALVDAGPGQAGPGRLVQLAALVVLYRRAAALGSELVVGVLGDPPEAWLSGELPELLPAWLRERRGSDPEPADVARATECLDADDRAWVLTTPALAARLPGRRRVLSAEPGGWTAGGASTVRVKLAGGEAELPLPAGDIAVRTLRGREFRRGGPSVPATVAPAEPELCHPAFTSTSRTLVARAAGAPGTIVTVNVPTHPSQAAEQGRPQRVRTRRHDLPGPVLAASRIGRRLVVLTVEEDRVRPHVIGRQLLSGRPWTPVPCRELGLDDGLLRELVDGPVLPVFYEQESFLLPLAGRWKRCGRDGRGQDQGALAWSGSAADDGKAFAWQREHRLRERPFPRGSIPSEARKLFAPGMSAWSLDGTDWHIQRIGGDPAVRVVSAGESVVGLTLRGRHPVLITVDPDGVVRCAGPAGNEPLHSLRGSHASPVVHPCLPLIAAQPGRDRLVVADPADRIHLTLGSQP